MNVSSKSVLACLLAAALPMSAHAQRISEILFNPPSTDAPNEFVELVGTPSSTIPANTYLVFIEGDSGTSTGDVQNIFSLGGLNFGSNGFLVLLQGSTGYTSNGSAQTITGAATGWTGVAGWSADSSATDIENSSFTALLIQTATPPSLSDDVDAGNDGIIDAPFSTNWTILDQVAVTDAATDVAYALVVFSEPGTVAGSPAGADIITFTSTPNYVGRFNGTTSNTAADWFGGGLEGTAPNFTLVAGETHPAAQDGAPVTGSIGSANAGSVSAVNDWTCYN